MTEKVMSDYKINAVEELVNKAHKRVVEEFDIKKTAKTYLNSYK